MLRATREVGRPDPALAQTVAVRVSEDVSRRFGAAAPGIEDVQDAVERLLLKAGRVEVARAYGGYRTRRAELRSAKGALGVRDELKLTLNAVAVLRERYLRRDERGRVVESTGQMMERVARHVAQADDEPERRSEEFAAF